MLSGMSITSCRTVPEFSRRSCSLLAANAELAMKIECLTRKSQLTKHREPLHYVIFLVDELRFVPNLDWYPNFFGHFLKRLRPGVGLEQRAIKKLMLNFFQSGASRLLFRADDQ